MVSLYSEKGFENCLYTIHFTIGENQEWVFFGEN